MRPVRLRSSRKFWPSDFLAERPCRRITSRSGGRSLDARCMLRRRPLLALVRRGEPRRELQRGDQARRIGLAGAGDIERGAVIGRGAHERQAERDVDAVVEGQRLDRDQRLVVVHAERGVVGLARRLVEHGIGRERAARVDAVGDQPLDRRAHDQAVFLAERAVLAGVRVEPGDREPRMGDAETIDQIARHHPAGLEDQVACEPLRHLLERHMDRDRHDGHFRRPQHHHRPCRVAGLLERKPGEIFGVARIGEAGLVEHALGDRIGDHGRGQAADHVGDGAVDRSDRGGRAGSVRLAGLGRCAAGRAAPRAGRGRKRQRRFRG